MSERVIYELKPKKKVSKFLSKQNEKTVKKLISAMDELRLFPPAGDIAPLKKTRGFYRLRVGSYRVIFSIDHNEKVVHIEDIDARGDVYKQNF